MPCWEFANGTSRKQIFSCNLSIGWFYLDTERGVFFSYISLFVSVFSMHSETTWNKLTFLMVNLTWDDDFDVKNGPWSKHASIWLCTKKKIDERRSSAMNIAHKHSISHLHHHHHRTLGNRHLVKSNVSQFKPTQFISMKYYISYRGIYISIWMKFGMFREKLERFEFLWNCIQ